MSKQSYIGGRGLEEGQEELPGQQVSQNAAVLHAERLHHGELAHLHAAQDVLQQLLSGRQDGHQSCWGWP